MSRNPHPMTGTLVHFVQPEPTSPKGLLSLGSFQMHVPPRIRETVTLQGAFGSVPQRFEVVNVIHHLPPIDEPPPSDDPAVNDVTCVVKQVVTDADIANVVAHLCRATANSLPGTIHRA